MQSFRRHKDTSGSVPTHWLPPDDADVELTDESESEAESVRGGVRVEDDEDDDSNLFRGVSNTVNNPCGDIIESAITVSEMLGCHKAISEKNCRSIVLSRASKSLERSRSRQHVCKICGG